MEGDYTNLETPIELTLILQIHATSKPTTKNLVKSFQEDQILGKEYIVKSQLCIRNILIDYLKDCPDSAVFLEGQDKTIDQTSINPESKKDTLRIFKNISCDFLTEEQKAYLYYFKAPVVLFILGTLPKIYITEDQCWKDIKKEVSLDLEKSYDEVLNRPEFFELKQIKQTNLERWNKCFYGFEQSVLFERYMQAIVEANPRACQIRERAVLNNILKIAEHGRKKSAILIYGINHKNSLIDLIEEEYKGRIILKWCINSLHDVTYKEIMKQREQLTKLYELLDIKYQKDHSSVSMDNLDKVLPLSKVNQFFHKKEDIFVKIHSLRETITSQKMLLLTKVAQQDQSMMLNQYDTQQSQGSATKKHENLANEYLSAAFRVKISQLKLI